MKKIILASVCLFLFFGAISAQQTITLTSDLVLTETWVFNESTTIIGNGFSLSCPDCSPMVSIKNGATVHFQDVEFGRDFTRWLNNGSGHGGTVTWSSRGMNGHLYWTEN